MLRRKAAGPKALSVHFDGQDGTKQKGLRLTPCMAQMRPCRRKGGGDMISIYRKQAARPRDLTPKT